jgi:hypothetical protein
MVGQSVVAAVDIDLGVVSFADESAHVFDFSVVSWNFNEFTSVPHCLSCIGIVFSSWLVVINSRPEIACDEIMTCDVGPFEEDAEPSVFSVCGWWTCYNDHVESRVEWGWVYFLILFDDMVGGFLPFASLDCIILFDVSS